MRSSDRQDSWEDKVESFLQNTSSNSLSVVPLLPQDFDPSKPPPMVTSSVVPPDYALTEYRDPILATHDPNGPASAIRQLMDVSTGQIIPQSGLHPPPTHISQPLPGILPQSGLVPPPDPYSVLLPIPPSISHPQRCHNLRLTM